MLGIDLEERDLHFRFAPVAVELQLQRVDPTRSYSACRLMVGQPGGFIAEPAYERPASRALSKKFVPAATNPSL